MSDDSSNSSSIRPDDDEISLDSFSLSSEGDITVDARAESNAVPYAKRDDDSFFPLPSPSSEKPWEWGMGVTSRY
jgi:hypothetical protein